jgi:hypothetical protein
VKTRDAFDGEYPLTRYDVPCHAAEKIQSAQHARESNGWLVSSNNDPHTGEATLTRHFFSLT